MYTYFLCEYVIVFVISFHVCISKQNMTNIFISNYIVYKHILFKITAHIFQIIVFFPIE